MKVKGEWVAGQDRTVWSENPTVVEAAYPGATRSLAGNNNWGIGVFLAVNRNS